MANNYFRDIRTGVGPNLCYANEEAEVHDYIKLTHDSESARVFEEDSYCHIQTWIDDTWVCGLTWTSMVEEHGLMNLIQYLRDYIRSNNA